MEETFGYKVRASWGLARDLGTLVRARVYLTLAHWAMVRAYNSTDALSVEEATDPAADAVEAAALAANSAISATYRALRGK